MEVTITHVEYGEETTDTVSGVRRIERDSDDLVVHWVGASDEYNSRYESATVEKVS